MSLWQGLYLIVKLLKSFLFFFVFLFISAFVLEFSGRIIGLKGSDRQTSFAIVTKTYPFWFVYSFIFSTFFLEGNYFLILGAFLFKLIVLLLMFASYEDKPHKIIFTWVLWLFAEAWLWAASNQVIYMINSVFPNLF